MSAVANDLKPETIRNVLSAFWNDALEIGTTPQGLSLAVPQTYPDGWQIIVDLDDKLPAGVKITDRGRTLSWLSSQGLNTDTDAVARQVSRICKEIGIERDGLELRQWIAKGIEAVQIHVFTEALVTISNLWHLRELKPRTLDVADRTLIKLFKDHGIDAIRGKTLDGRVREKVRLDYYVERRKPIAFQLVRQHGRILSTMERWGFRWNDLKSKHPSLRPAMLYDPHHQEVDSESRSIGEEVCELFCSYEETNRIHEFLEVE